jgi:hypothetical protein
MQYLIPSLVGLLYAGQAIYHLKNEEWGFALMWFAYSLANLGIILAMAAGDKGH